MGIRSKLLICLMVVLVPVAAASLYALGVIDERLTSRIESDLGNSRRLEAARIGQVLEDYRQDAMSLAAGSHIRDFLGDLDAHRRGTLPSDVDIGGVDGFATIDREAEWPLQQLALNLQRTAGIIGTEAVELRIVGRDGRTLGESIGFDWTPRDEALVERAMTGAVPLFGDAFRNLDGHRRLGLVAPVSGARGQVVGALLLETRLGHVVDLVGQHEGMGETSEAHLAQRLPNGDAEFITLLRFDREAALSRTVPADSPAPIVRSLSSPDGEVLRAPDYRGADSVLAIETIPSTGWGLVVKIDAREAFAPLCEVTRAIRNAVLATILVIIAGWAFVLHPLARRLLRSAAAAQRIADGDLSSRIGDTTEDEIGEVARSIDRLSAELSLDRQMRGEIEERLRHQAQHDELTGLHNRKRANGIIAELGETPEREAAIAFLDLDGFKAVNDLYGHAAGDAVLVAIAGRLRDAIDGRSTLARWGGDEFVVILPDGDERAAEAVAARIRRLFDEPIVTDFGTHQLGCSIGTATAGPGRTLAEAVVDADARMYEQKRGRRQDRSYETVAARNVEKALRDDRIETWYQPIVAVSPTGETRLQGAEALVRMRTRSGAIVGPDAFLGEVRKRDLGRELDRRVMTRALEAFARWRLAGVVPDTFRIAVNLTGESLRTPAFVDDVREQLARLDVPAERLVVELSEKTVDIDATVLTRLRGLGVGLALDDVGLHRSNLDRLVGLAPDVAKIDRQWVNDDVVLPRLVDICRQLGMEVVAEGVETREQLERLGALDVDRFQGFLFGRPTRGVAFVGAWGRTAPPDPGVARRAPIRVVS